MLFHSSKELVWAKDLSLNIKSLISCSEGPHRPMKQSDPVCSRVPDRCILFNKTK